VVGWLCSGVHKAIPALVQFHWRKELRFTPLISRTALCALFVLTTLASLVTVASAAPVQIDFNVAGFGPAPNTVQSFTKDNVVDDVDFTWEALDEMLLPADKLYWDADDGLGHADGFGVVGSGYADDEVEGNERLGLKFSRALTLLGFNLTDLFNEREPSTSDCVPGNLDGCIRERGSYMVQFGDGTFSAWNEFQADADKVRSGNGEFAMAVNFENVVAMYFSAPGFDGVKWEDYSLAGVKVDAQPPQVPEPGTMVLVGTGLVAAWVKRRRNRS
jgi:hypothetical protein